MEETNVTIYFYDFIKEFINASEICNSKNLKLPTLVILYTGMDIMGSLTIDEAKAKFDQDQLNNKVKEKFGTRHSFTYWAEKYLKPNERLNPKCKAIDLYGARCGLLHELRLESDLSNKDKAKVISYAWGNAKLEDLEKTIEKKKKSTIAIHINDLIDAFKKGIFDFVNDIKKDSERLNRINKQSERFVSNLSTKIIKDFLEIPEENN